MMSTSALELRAGARLLVSGVNVRINHGDRIGFVGRNGAGKSTLANTSKKIKPKVVVDLGSGVSTLVLAKSSPNAKVFSIDHLAEFANKTKSLLEDHQITNVDLRVAPLSPHPAGGDWYSVSAFSDIDQIDLLFIDGPPGSKDDKARHPALAQCLSKLSPGAVIVIDDAGRDGERELAEMFLSALPGYELEFLNHEKGTAVLRPR